METIDKKFGNAIKERVSRVCIFLFLLSCININPGFAQETDSITDTAASATSSEGPSLKNLSKNLSAGNEEIARLKEKARRDEILSYIYMGLGFAVVIGIAWFTTALAKKRRKKEDEQRAARAQHHPKHKPHHPRR